MLRMTTTAREAPATLLRDRLHLFMKHEVTDDTTRIWHQKDFKLRIMARPGNVCVRVTARAKVLQTVLFLYALLIKQNLGLIQEISGENIFVIPNPGAGAK